MNGCCAKGTTPEGKTPCSGQGLELAKENGDPAALPL